MRHSSPVFFKPHTILHLIDNIGFTEPKYSAAVYPLTEKLSVYCFGLCLTLNTTGLYASVITWLNTLLVFVLLIQFYNLMPSV